MKQELKIDLIRIIFLWLIVIPINVFAYTGPLDDEFFTINNQTTSPFNISISGNSSTDVTFKLDYFYNHNISNYDIPGSYLFVSIESNKKLSINRKYNFGSNCSSSCFSNDDYLMLNSDSNGYSYVYYFNIVKWARTVGTQIDQFSVADVFTFHNLESGTATVYIYGSYANNTNDIPNLIQNVETKQQIIIGNESIESTLNQNTQQIIDLFNNCEIIDRNSNGFTNEKYLRNNGVIGNSQYYGITDYINISSATVDVVTPFTISDSGTYLCYYTEDKSLISCQNIYNLTSLTIPNNSYYLRTSVFTYNTNNSPILKVCKNSNQVIIDKQDVTNDKLDDLNDTMKDSSIDNPNSDFSDMEDMIAHNGVITNLIALPITLYSSILNGLNQSCSEYNFGNLFGTDLKFQCINLGTLLGNTIWGVIDVLFSGFTIYAIAKKMIKVFNNFSGLNEGDVIDD